ncbi:arylsulfatase [Flavilitoribacter nigricans]|uniref:N-acetylgalactosamine-4-sulfatase n=1 Tax=Flavilitoribacter nigricans (strain ATCC 23147 / DSM 23189 / NBRC 102662 / NCIMB 1420 / SS-2) TaxID=1122177 RepID=A0A2D0N2M8_FLAN2|nr:arylsulfatase [Flavilitoribacter nigricans]PHN02764.1 n-acetylgalactosamine-4-sulfatase [Flavilitoribacter nigricans DSM 23189 = NBRC 102662]
MKNQSRISNAVEQIRKVGWIGPLVILSLLSCTLKSASERPPNVILVLTDDQGIGDLGCHGNPWLKTPNLDAFYADAIRLTNFHVSPLCTPTRAALMTGRYPIRNGTWATYKGRDALAEGITTIAEIFQRNGYATGIFGKWHLGDNYPVRPTDKGFGRAIHHKAGGVGELSDYWGNSYFDDVYYVDNEPQSFVGYCTDVWFREAMKFMEAKKEEPFFVYLPTNAPHDPFIVAENYAAPYAPLEGNQIPSADFYGMIANIDENFGKLGQFLRDQELLDNTILIFMTDNGSSGGMSRDGELGYNQGFRGRKGDATDGGHRVPFFIRWPDGNIRGGLDIGELSAHIDLYPTLAALCRLDLPDTGQLDGLDLSSLLLRNTERLPDRTVFVHHRQDWRPPLATEQTCLMRDQWRLINGRELYDVERDRHQDTDRAEDFPVMVRSILQDNDRFISTSMRQPTYREMPVTVIGNEHQPEVKLTIQHAIGEGKGIWKAQQVAEGLKNPNNTHALRVDRAGWYKIACRRWPKECPGPLHGVPDKNPKGLFDYRIIKPEKARISIANQLHEQIILGREEAAVFTVYLEEGKTLLVNDFVEGREQYGVYYTYIRFLETGPEHP